MPTHYLLDLTIFRKHLERDNTIIILQKENLSQDDQVHSKYEDPVSLLNPKEIQNHSGK